ncbi:hypothetical protein [Streptomyces spinosirectus]
MSRPAAASGAAAAPAADPRPCPGAGAGRSGALRAGARHRGGFVPGDPDRPLYGAAQVARFGNGQWLDLDCWTTGAPDADGHGYRYWMQVSTGSRSGFVNDWYQDSDGPNTWKSQIRHC